MTKSGEDLLTMRAFCFSVHPLDPLRSLFGQFQTVSSFISLMLGQPVRCFEIPEHGQRNPRRSH